MHCEIDDSSIYYEVRGEGNPVVMVHGFSLDHRVLGGCMEPTFQDRKGWKRIYFDLPGMGRSERGSHIIDSDRMLSAVMEFINRVVPDGRFVLVGESYGGYLARAIVRARPEQVAGLLLICPLIVAERSLRSLPKRTVFVQDRELLMSLEQRDRRDFVSMAVVQDRRVWTRFEREVLPGIRAGDAQFLNAFMRTGYPMSDDGGEYPPFPNPTLVLTGRGDGWVGYQDAMALMEEYPSGTFAVLDRCGHLLQIEQERVFNAMVGEWLDRVEGTIGNKFYKP